MNSDLAKAAYLKAEELSLRVAALENKKPSPVFSTTDMSFKIYCKGSAVKTASFIATGEQNIAFSITLSPSDITCSVTLNGSPISLNNGEVNSSTDIAGGENKFVFNFTASTEQWVEVSLTVEGFIEKYSPKRFLSAVGGSYYSYFDDGTFYLCSAPSQTPKVALYDVRHAFANYTSASGILVSSIDVDGRLKIQRYYSNGNLYVETEAAGNYSRCVVRVKNGYVALYVIAGNYLKTGFVQFSGQTSLKQSNIRAKDISFRTVGASDYLLVTDIDGSVYLCTLSDTNYVTVTSKRSPGKYAQASIANADGNPAIWHYKGGAVLETVLNNGRFTPNKRVALADEAIKIDAGYRITRTGNQLTITY